MRRLLPFLIPLLALLPLPPAAAEAPLQATGGAVTVTAAALAQSPVPVGFAPLDAPVLGPAQTGPGHQLLRRLFASGRAGGNAGDLYDNRDRGHSRLAPEAHPQLTHLRYDNDLRGQGADYGLAGDVLFAAPLIGNSSTARTDGPFWRSQARQALTEPGGAARLYRQYAAGQIYVYPEHRDHDPGRGDLIPANTPYLLISQGSSGSDRAHLQALAMILAAFRPETKDRLKELGLVAPTVQMVYRRARVGVRSPEAYRSGAAHPSVFRASDINLARMVSLANAIPPDAIPPMVRLSVLEETISRPGIDHFGQGVSEVLFDTQSAIARIWRNRAGRREMVLSAADTTDPNGRDLRFDWALLRGDPERVTITPLTPDGRYAQVVVDWQDPQPVPGRPDLTSARIDIGVFADNGAFPGAPAFVSILLPAHERRSYAPGPDGPVPEKIDRRAAPGVYADPLLFPVISWTDRYEAQGGWLREYEDARPPARFDEEGRRLPPIPQVGAPAPVVYPLERLGDGTVAVRERPADSPAMQEFP